MAEVVLIRGCEMLTRDVCRRLGEVFGLWAVSLAEGAAGTLAEADAGSAVERSELYSAARRELMRQEGEFYEDSPLYGELRRSMAAANFASVSGEVRDVVLLLALDCLARLLEQGSEADLRQEVAAGLVRAGLRPAEARKAIDSLRGRLTGTAGAEPTPASLRLIAVYPEGLGNLDPVAELIAGRPADGAGSNGEQRDMDWWYEGRDVGAAEQALRRLRADGRFEARLVEVREE
jgi:hypothetical protein